MWLLSKYCICRNSDTIEGGGNFADTIAACGYFSDTDASTNQSKSLLVTLLTLDLFLRFTLKEVKWEIRSWKLAYPVIDATNQLVPIQPKSEVKSYAVLMVIRLLSVDE